MRNWQKQQQLLLRLANLISIFFLILLLDADQLVIVPASSLANCSTSPTFCSSGNFIVSFPFFTSDECSNHTQSSFVISNCDNNSYAHPDWPGFTKHAITSNNHLNSSTVMSIYIPPPPPPHTNSLNGFINLTWSTPPLINHQSTKCSNLSSLEQISDYIPQSINLQHFSAFKFDPSNIILLFDCNTTQIKSSTYQKSLEMNSSACISYEEKCKIKTNCYQYTIPNPSMELNLSQVMSGSGCKQAMFFVTLNTSLPVLTWKPGFVRLNWSSTGTDRLASTLQKCASCLQGNGSCGYDSRDNFQCFCGSELGFPNCSHIPITPPSPVHSTKKIIIVVGVAGFFGMALALVALFCFNKRKNKLSWIKRPLFLPSFPSLLKLNGASNRPDLVMSNYSISKLDLDMLTQLPIDMTYSSIVSATRSFSDRLGEGGFGVVYRGDIGGVQVAVKALKVTSEHTKKHFINEVATIGRIHHVHVVRLLGFCIEGHHRILICEYANNGSLDTWLFKQRHGYPKRFLHWKERYAIAVGIAKGLGYLHEECRHRIVHCDIKPQNILLDEHMCPKIADFGLARLMGTDETQVATLARGTPGYIAPECWIGGEIQLSTKCDVYSFGMVLLELISGHPNFGSGHPNFGSGVCFPEEAFEAAMRGDIGSIVDMRLGITSMPVENIEPNMAFDTTELQAWQQVRTALFVALWCIQDRHTSRPHMSEVVLYLDGTIPVSEQPPRPAIASLDLRKRLSRQSNHHHHHDITPISGR